MSEDSQNDATNDESADTSREADEVREERRSEGRADDVKTLGLERWVQFAFVGIAALTFFLSDKLIGLVYGFAATLIERWGGTHLPDLPPLLVSALAAVIGAVTGFALYRHKRLGPFAHEVAAELAKVTWPSRKETWYSTVVVIVTSVIAAVYLGVFDALWSAFTDLVYKT